MFGFGLHELIFFILPLIIAIIATRKLGRNIFFKVLIFVGVFFGSLLAEIQVLALLLGMPRP